MADWKMGAPDLFVDVFPIEKWGIFQPAMLAYWRVTPVKPMSKAIYRGPITLIASGKTNIAPFNSIYMWFWHSTIASHGTSSTKSTSILTSTSLSCRPTRSEGINATRQWRRAQRTSGCKSSLFGTHYILLGCPWK